MAESGPGGGTIDLVTEANNNESAEDEFTIGEPESDDFDIHASVCYSHHYFKKISGTDTAVCLTCQRANTRKGPRDIKKKDAFRAGNV